MKSAYKNKTEQIGALLLKYRRVGKRWCWENGVSERLAARIGELREAGWVIRTEELPDRDTHYVLVSAPQEQLKLL